jgi:hypothetical protein
MATTAANVRVGVSGAVSFAPTGTALPVTPTATLNAAFEEVGYINEDGLTTSTSTDTNDIKAWQNGDIVRRVQTSHDFTIQFAMLETNELVLELYYGNFTHGALGAPGVATVRGEQGTRGAWVFDVEDGDDLIRIVVPDGQVTEREDVQYVNGDAVQYGVTLTTYPDASGNKAYIYFETDAAS